MGVRSLSAIFALLPALVAASAALAACAPEAAAPSHSAPAPAYTAPRHPPGPMEGVRASRMGDVLAAAGLDVRNLPPLEALSPGQKQKVMRTFTETLGVPCLGCHAEDEFGADTRRKRVAKRMFNEVVRVLTLRDGEPLYCDSCHDGTMHMLDRREGSKLAEHMCDTLVGQIARVDGRPHDCTSCHGDPPDFKILTTWKRTSAPEIVVDAARAGGPMLVPVLPAEGVRAPADCGPKSELCPLQRLMRSDVALAAAAEDGALLAKALERVTRFSLDPSWAWAAISRAGADAARRGDLTGARQACSKCHEAYKAAWRASHRTRALP